MRWQFITPGAPHQNGCAEVLVKGTKKALKIAIGEQVLSPFELYTCLLEVANLMNQRPIGRITNDPDDGLYLSQRHAPLTSHLNGARKTVQRNQEPTAYSRIRTEESGHLLETLDPRRVPVVGPQKDVEC